MRKLLFIFAAMLLSSIGLHAQTTVIPHPFTVGTKWESSDQVPYAVYFTDQNFDRDKWKESYVDGQRLLTAGEWEYVLQTREINGHFASQLRGWATIIRNGGDPNKKEDILQLGLVLLPDDWGYTHYFDNNVWYKNSDYTDIVFTVGKTFGNNTYTETDWVAMQQAGAVFLPCETSNKIYGSGDYWSATKNVETGDISYALFQTSSTTPEDEHFQINTDNNASNKRFIRLVQESVTITLNEETNNTDLLTSWKMSGKPVNVYLIRSLTPGMYNTFCLPFDLTEQEVTETFGAEAKVAKFTNGTLSEDKQTLEIVFESCTTIEAGVPYLIQPTQGMTNPTFYNRVIKETQAAGETFFSADKIEYLGIINPHHIPAGDMKYLFLQANNNLIWSKADDTSSMKGMRGYFYVPNMPDMPTNCPARLSVRQAPQTPTELQITDNSKQITGKILYKGRFVIIKDNKMYNILGM